MVCVSSKAGKYVGMGAGRVASITVSDRVSKQCMSQGQVPAAAPR